jgi:thiamine transport system permease protein
MDRELAGEIRTLMQTLAQNRGKLQGELLLLPVLVFFTLFFLMPVMLFFTQAFTENGSLSLQWFTDIFTKSYYLRILSFTLLQALLSTVLSLILGIPGGWILSHYDFPGKKIITALTTIPFILPSILVVLGFILFWGRSGVVNQFLMALFALDEPPLTILYSFNAILLAHVFYNFPIALRMISSWWTRFPVSQVKAARTLGAGNWKIFRTIIFPQMVPALMSAGTLIFLYCFMSFAVILVLGGGPKYSTMEVEVYRLVKYSLDFNHGAALGIVETVVTLGLTFLYLRIEKKTSHSDSTKIQRKSIGSAKNGRKLLFLFYLAVIIIIILGPILTVAVQSFLEQRSRAVPASFSLKWYGQVFGADSRFSDLGAAFANSMGIAFFVILFTLSLGLYISWTITRKPLLYPSLTESLIMMPMAVSSVILGMGYLMVLRLQVFSWMPLRLTIILAHTLIALPFAIRSLTPVFRRIRPSLLASSRILGAGTWKTLRAIELPLIRPGIITAGAFALAISLGEINATMILSDAGIITIPVAIYQLIGNYKFFAACALGTVLIVTCLIAFLLIDSFEGWEE